MYRDIESELVDLCLYRQVQSLTGRILPYGIRDLIKKYVYETLHDLNIQSAVTLWCDNRSLAITRYGTIEEWDTRTVTNMSELFNFKRTFNSDISLWNVSNVTTMRSMFEEASSFNQPLDTWNVSNVTDMQCIFLNALSFNQPLDTW